MGRSRGGLPKDYCGGELVALWQRALLNISLVQVGEPTILVNNAGVVQGKMVTDLSAEDVQQYVIYIYVK